MRSSRFTESIINSYVEIEYDYITISKLKLRHSQHDEFKALPVAKGRIQAFVGAAAPEPSRARIRATTT